MIACRQAPNASTVCRMLLTKLRNEGKGLLKFMLPTVGASFSYRFEAINWGAIRLQQLRTRGWLAVIHQPGLLQSRD